MLYKKYHRNFVRQFRKGVKAKSKYSNANFIISEVKTIIDFAGEINIIIKDGKKPWRAIIFSEGTIISEVKLEKDVIQEIS